MTTFAIQEGDILNIPSDLLILKYAQAFYGTDKIVAERLVRAGLCSHADIAVPPGKFVVFNTNGVIAPRKVLFVGTPPLNLFLYREMNEFAQIAVKAIASLRLQPKEITTIVHGTRYGLDGGEALQQLINGFHNGFLKHRMTTVETITFLTLDPRDARMLSTALQEMVMEEESPYIQLREFPQQIQPIPTPQSASYQTQQAGISSTLRQDSPMETKSRVFVAMPFSEDFENVYEFGIYPAIRDCDLICEKVNELYFAGDILARITAGIINAKLVIADLSEARPNVYLEVGYAWGKNIPVIFVAKKGTQLHFDVSTHRCIYYGKYTQLKKDLQELIQGLNINTL